MLPSERVFGKNANFFKLIRNHQEGIQDKLSSTNEVGRREKIETREEANMKYRSTLIPLLSLKLAKKFSRKL